jgi:hypothetical protein
MSWRRVRRHSIRIRTTDLAVTHPGPHPAPGNDIDAASMSRERHQCSIDVVT